MSKLGILSELGTLILLTAGCASTTLTMQQDPVTGKWHKQWGRGGSWAIYQDSVDRPLRKELAGEPPPDREPTWQGYWIGRCELINYAGVEQKHIDYIIEQRRQMKLPDIPEIAAHTFRSPWQVFTNAYDPDIEREAQGLPPLAQQKTWPDYWRSKFEMIRLNKNIGEKGVTYIKQKREELHLPPVAEARKGLIH